MGWKIPLVLKSAFVTTRDSAVYASTVAWVIRVITAVSTSVPCTETIKLNKAIGFQNV